MNNYKSKIKFLEFASSSHYLRVDETHSLDLLIGLNDSGHKTLRFIGDFNVSKVKSTKSIKVTHYKVGDKFAVNFSLQNEEYTDLFYLFCNDMIDSSRNIKQSNGYIYLINRFNKWRGFSNSNRKYLSESSIKGLIGELIFLQLFAQKKYGYEKSISAWTGPEASKKDFSFNDIWYEIKTTSNIIVKINSIEQLESDQTGYLVVYNLEKISPQADGYSINRLFESIYNAIEIDHVKNNFKFKMLELGVFNEEYYDNFVYRIQNTRYYKVSNDFPLIKNDNLPKAITNVSYDLDLNLLDKFKENLA